MTTKIQVRETVKVPLLFTVYLSVGFIVAIAIYPDLGISSLSNPVYWSFLLLGVAICTLGYFFAKKAQ